MLLFIVLGAAKGLPLFPASVSNDLKNSKTFLSIEQNFTTTVSFGKYLNLASPKSSGLVELISCGLKTS